jgi:hypothetical protein
VPRKRAEAALCPSNTNRSGPGVQSNPSRDFWVTTFNRTRAIFFSGGGPRSFAGASCLLPREVRPRARCSSLPDYPPDFVFAPVEKPRRAFLADRSRVLQRQRRDRPQPPPPDESEPVGAGEPARLRGPGSRHRLLGARHRGSTRYWSHPGRYDSGGDRGGAGADLSRVGPTHTCGLEATRVAWCWGSNTYGELGSSNTDQQCGATTCQMSPVPAADGMLFSELAAGLDFTCGLTMWGRCIAGG